jgi:hypothetical protein
MINSRGMACNRISPTNAIASIISTKQISFFAVFAVADFIDQNT